MSVIRPFTHEVFCSRKVNAVHSLTHYVRDTPVIRYVQQMSVVLFSEKGRGFWVKGASLFKKTFDPFSVVYSFLHFSMSSPYSSRWRRTMFSTKLERLLLLSPSLRTMKSARSCAPYSDRPPFGCSVLLEQGRLVCRLRAFPFSSWHWRVSEQACSPCSVQALSAWYSICSVRLLVLLFQESLPFLVK